MSQPLVSRTCNMMHRSPQPSAAVHFLTQCRRSLSTTRSTSGQPLDFLIPSYRPSLKSRHPARSPVSLQYPNRHPFSITPTPRQTAVLLNPRTDDEGSRMTIDISPRAAKRLQQITSSTSPGATQSLSHLGSLARKQPTPSPSDHLRVSVTSGGCHGFQYLMSLEPADKISEEDDTVFVAQHESSSGAARDAESKGKAVVVMDEPSLELLRGSTIDYTTELIGSQFKVVGNPRASSSCGCGTSFDVAS